VSLNKPATQTLGAHQVDRDSHDEQPKIGYQGGSDEILGE
jgi:hypothetical protein